MTKRFAVTSAIVAATTVLSTMAMAGVANAADASGAVAGVGGGLGDSIGGILNLIFGFLGL